MMLKPLDQQDSLEIRYEKSVKALLDLALERSDEQARIAADVLLSANGAKQTPYRKWRIQIGELCLLNTMAFDAAIGVILGRTQLHLHPAFIIQNGNNALNDSTFFPRKNVLESLLWSI